MVQLCPGAGSDRDRRAFIGIYRSLCPQLQSRGLREDLQDQGAIHGSCRLWGGGSPCSALSQEPAQPLVEDKLHILLCAEGNLSGYILWRMKHEDVLLHSVILRGLAWLMICPLIFHGVCVCVFSLSHFLRVTELF